MCGIAGLSWRQPRSDSADAALDAVRRMAFELRHRGPDGEGFALALGPDGDVLGALGHRRLAIVDENGGAQPFVDGDLVLVANAEIYGHEALRHELESLGARFRSRCDAEVILHGYRHWGDGVVDRIDGMFAFAVWDGAKRRLLLARDRLGQKPLYYAADADRFVFASEASALSVGRDVAPSISADGLARYLLLDFVPTPRSIFEGVHSLPAGSTLIVENGEPRDIESYFSLPAARGEGGTRADLVAEVRDLFDDAVLRRRMSDRPVGLFLSGGLDSTIVGAGLVRAQAEVRSYSVRFAEAGYDESEEAKRAADWLGTTHTDVSIQGADVPELAANVLGSLDEPLADGSTLAVSAVSRRAAEDVKVVIGGDGADELFGGYSVFQAARLDAASSFLGGLRPKLLRWAATVIGTRDGHFSLDFLLRQFARGLEFEPDARAVAYTFNDSTGAILNRMAQPPKERALAEDAHIEGSDLIDAMFRAYQGLFLESNILRKVDRAGMAHGLEVRSPFLDHRLVEAVGALPASRRVYGMASKPILRAAFAGRVPDWTLKRRKQGFIVPIAKWINRDLSNWFDELIHERLPEELIIRKEAAGLLNAHREGRLNARKPLWNLAALALWHEGWRARSSKQRPRV